MSDRGGAPRAGYSQCIANHPGEKLWSKLGLLCYVEELVCHATPPEYLVGALSKPISSVNPARGRRTGFTKVRPTL
jgi:hypothetical protein